VSSRTTDDEQTTGGGGARAVLSPDGLFDPLPFGFAQAAIVTTHVGRELHISGQVALDADQNIIGDGDVGGQVEVSLRNIEKALATAGATLDQVGGLRIYIRESEIHHGEAITAGLKSVFGDCPPTTTWIGVPCLARDEFLVEIEPSVVLLPKA